MKRTGFLSRVRAVALPLALAALAITTSFTSLETPRAEAGPAARARKATAARSARRARARRAKKAEARQPLRGALNVNTASASELRRLPGIGPSLAERIVAWRQRRGKFRRLRDLRRVKGIGQKTLAKLRPYLVLKGANTLH